MKILFYFMIFSLGLFSFAYAEKFDVNDLVINEFMADNETTIADQDGEYDDWIELYNNGTEEISLLGYFLSDDINEQNKWAFPDVSIGAGEYLIIWADKDLEQEGLHANLKLSSSGEAIILSDDQLNIIDEISFDLQNTDVSMGRFPNGTGDFLEMTPTFNSENSDEALSVEIYSFNSNIYPNPTNDVIFINLDKINENVTLKLINLLGKVVFIEQNLTTNKIKIDMNNFQKGIYFINIELDNFVYSEKIIKN